MITIRTKVAITAFDIIYADLVHKADTFWDHIDGGIGSFTQLCIDQAAACKEIYASLTISGDQPDTPIREELFTSMYWDNKSRR